jgi:cutinase
MPSFLTLLVLSLSLVSASPVAVPRAAGDTRNDLTNGSGCKAMTVIFARGTTETGNVGTLTGPPFFTALDSAMGAGQVAVQGVEYPADIPGFLAGGDKAGSAKMAQMVTQTLAKCPDTKIVMSGYSQGGKLYTRDVKTLLMLTVLQANLYIMRLICLVPARPKSAVVSLCPCSNTPFPC